MSRNRSEIRIRMKKWSENILASPGLFFAVTASVFGLLFLLITPPLQGPDEQAHFVQIYKYSENPFSSADTLPKSLGLTYRTVFYEDDIRFNGNEKYELGRTKHALFEIPLDQTDRENGRSHTGTGYSPLAYLPHILIVFIGRVLDAPIIVLIYLARLGGLMLWVGLVYAAIRISPIAKRPFAVIALLPMAVFSSAVVTSDVMAHGGLMLFIALITRIVLSKKKVSVYEALALAGITLLLVLSKIVMMVFLPLLLLLLFKKDSRTQRSQLIAMIIFIVAVGAIVAAVWQQLAPAASPDSVTSIPKNVIPAEQIRLLFEAPYKFFFALWNTYFYAWGDGIFYSIIGTFGWVDTAMALPFILLGYGILITSLVANRSDDYEQTAHLGLIPRVGILLTAVAFFFAVNAAIYIYYSPVDFNIIVGLQGRYFLPLLVICALLFVNRGTFKVGEKAYKAITLIFPTLLLFVSLVYIFTRYYLDTRI